MFLFYRVVFRYHFWIYRYGSWRQFSSRQKIFPYLPVTCCHVPTSQKIRRLLPISWSFH